MSLLGGDQKEVEVPLMAMNEAECESEDGEQDVVAINGKKKKGFSVWSPWAAHRKRMLLTGGRRNWKAGVEDGRACSCRPIICIPLTVMLFMSLVLMVFVLYPIVHRYQGHVNSWTTTSCEPGLSLMTDLCSCLDNVFTNGRITDDGVMSVKQTLLFKLHLTNCLYTCVNEHDEIDAPPGVEVPSDDSD